MVIKDATTGLYEYVYDLGDAGVWTVVITRGEVDEKSACDNPDHGHEVPSPPRYWAHLRLMKDGELLYEGCPDAIMAYECNSLIVSSSLIAMTAILNFSVQTQVMRNLSGEETYERWYANMMADAEREGIRIKLFDLDEIKRIAPYGGEVFRIIDLSNEAGEHELTPDEMEQQFGFRSPPKIEFTGVNLAPLDWI